MYFSIAALSALAAAVVAAPYGGHGQRQPSLYEAMEATGRDFLGVALTLRNNQTETDIILQNFNSVTPENAMKWGVLQPNNRTSTDWSGADAIADFATKYDMEIHCHNLIWHSQLPPWVENGNFTNATLIQVMDEHIKSVVTRYKKVCTRWDVVNEALNDDGTYRDSVFLRTIGPAYLPISFRLAAKYADKHTDLYYNDYNLEYNNNKTIAARKIVELVQSYGVKIDGVGFQGHVTSEATPTSPGAAPDQATLEAAFRNVAAPGVDVAYTEIDVRMLTPATPEKLATQATVYQHMAAACIAVKACNGMTVWGVSDGNSWIPGVFKGEGAALIWDEAYKPKPAYNGFLAGIES